MKQDLMTQGFFFFMNHLLAALYMLSLWGSKLHIMVSIECLFLWTLFHDLCG